MQVKGHIEDTFIEEYHIDNSVCDDLINFYNDNIDKAKSGSTLGGVFKDIKDSTDLAFKPGGNEITDNYLNEVWKKCIIPYSYKYSQGLIDATDSWGYIQ